MIPMKSIKKTFDSYKHPNKSFLFPLITSSTILICIWILKLSNISNFKNKSIYYHLNSSYQTIFLHRGLLDWISPSHFCPTVFELLTEAILPPWSNTMGQYFLVKLFLIEKYQIIYGTLSGRALLCPIKNLVLQPPGQDIL